MAQRIPKVVLPVMLACILLAFYIPGIKSVEFQPDESQWIGTSQVFEAYVGGQFHSPYFDQSYWTVTQPPLARYIIGLSRRIGGYMWADLNKPWMWGQDTAANTREGSMPSEGLLWWSRLPMALLAVASIMIGYVVVKAAAGQIAGCIWVILNGVSSYMLLQMRRAMGDAPLIACVVLVMYLSYRALLAGSTEKSAPSWKVLGWLALLGVAAGAAGNAKLNGMSAVLAGVAVAAIVAARLKGAAYRKLLFALLASSVALVTSVGAFVGLNPFLWPDPVGRTRLMLDQRFAEMADQAKYFPDSHIDGLAETVAIVPNRVLHTDAAISFDRSLVVNALALTVGLCLLLYQSWKAFARGSIDAGPAAIMLVGIATSTPSLFTPLDWDRYYLLPVFFTTMFVAVAFGSVASKLYQAAKALRWAPKGPVRPD